MAETEFGENSGPLRVSPQAARDIRFANGFRLLVEDVRHGGMGSVHIGALEGQQLRIAAKSFRDDLFLNTATRIAFLQEASIWSRLSGCPFVLPMMGSWKSTDNITYLIMPAVSPTEGGAISLRDRLTTNPGGLKDEEVFTVAAAIATAMDRAGKVVPGIVHGDLKPENILLLGGLPHVSDFGISVADTRGHGSAAGSPQYMSPQRFERDHRLCVSDDIFAFGRIVCECLTGATTCGSDADRSALTLDENDGSGSNNPHATRLTRALLDLAISCVARLPQDRPKDFSEVLDPIIKMGMKFAPDAFLKIVYVATELPSIAEGQLDARIPDLIENGDYHEALKLILTVPEVARTPEHWMWAGTASSLLNDDEAALQHFERCLSTNPSKATELLCKSEKGLSLRRLRRYDEAIKLFRSIVDQPTEADSPAAQANLAGTLLDAGKLDEASNRSTILTQQYPDDPGIWVLDGQIKSKRGDAEGARASFRRAVHLDPSNLMAQIELADILAIEYGDVRQALTHLDIAFTQGRHTPDLIFRLVAMNMVLQNVEETRELLEKVRASSPEIADSLLRHAVDYTRKIVRQREPRECGGQPNEVNISSSSLSGAEDGAQVPLPSPGEAEPSYRIVVLESGILLEETAQLPMIGFRAYQGPDIFAMDYYAEISQAYAEGFGKAFRQFSRGIVLQLGPQQMRNSLFRFVRCAHCHFTIFSNRSAGEQLPCGMCEQRGPLSPVIDPQLDQLASLCEAEAGLAREIVGGKPFAFAVALPNASYAASVISVCEQHGWTRSDEKGPIGSMLRFLSLQRGFKASLENRLLFTRSLPEDEISYGGTPESIQQLLMRLYPIAGRLSTASIDLDILQGEMIGGMPGIAQRIRAESGMRPTDPETLALLIECLVDHDHEEARNLVAFSQQIVGQDHPQLESARAFYALRSGEYAAACELFKKVKMKMPLDFGARAGLIDALKALGLEDDATSEMRELRAIGYRVGTRTI
ncbi:protein kinase family protein [Bradyrhizobium yuanmingense]|uniref:Serine/threonine protein kinase/Flp pilus assembly protein TadD n=1 Tax=Bradyrhizobium yuanmingense TaxID=108015 RepID=A0ABV4GKK2_9BRAD|nr:protein kinase family protein [Bradyrhizobium yuanmingense]